MDLSEQIEIIRDCAYFRPSGKLSLSEATRLVTEAIKFVRDRQVPKLLINTTGLTGFSSPTLPERYFMAREWAMAALDCVRVVLVIPITMIDPNKFGITVARNAGMDAEVFATEEEALTWLAQKRVA